MNHFSTQLDVRYYFKIIEAPVGPLKLVATERGLAAILWANDNPSRVRLNLSAALPGHPVLLETERQLDEYFAGTRREFELPLDFAGTPFQVRVWAALLRIPYGETRSYSELAMQIGSPGAARAVGAANGRNPISIVAPCHRVIGSDGALTGFAGGLATKAYLLALEGCRKRAAELPRARDPRQMRFAPCHGDRGTVV